MNAPLPVLKTAPSKLSHEFPQLSAGRNRADDAPTLRNRSAETAPGDSFGDLLKKASDKSAQHADERSTTALKDGPGLSKPKDRSTADDVAGAARDQSSQADASKPTGVSGDTDADGDGAKAATAQTSASTSTASVTGDGESAAHVSSAAQGGANANAVQANPAQQNQHAGQGAMQNADAPQHAAPQQAAQAEAAAANARSTKAGGAQQATAASQQNVATTATTPANAAQHANSAAAQSSPRSADAQTTRVDSTNAANQPATAATAAINTAAGHSATNSNTDQQSQQQSNSQGSATQQLKQQVAQAAQQANGNPAEETAAVRRYGQVNAQVQAENTTGMKAVSIESLSSQPSSNASITPQPTLDLGAASRGTVQPVQMPSGQLVDQSQVTSNVVRSMSALVNQRGGVMHMRLDPPELGQLRVQMTISRGAVSAQFHAATAQAQQVLERNMTALRMALERHGLTVEKITVQTQQPAQSNNASNQQMNQQNADQSGQNNQHDAGDGRSRGRDEQHGDQQNPQQQNYQPFETFFDPQRGQSFAETVDHVDAGAATGVAS